MQNLLPITKKELGEDINPLGISDELWQLQTDTVNVLEGRININTFSLEYQEKIKNFYKYSGYQTLSNVGILAPRTRSTLDIV